MLINAVENTFVTGEFGGSERKSGGQGGSIHVTGDQKMIQAGGKSGFEAIGLLEEGGRGGNEQGSQGGADLFGDLG